MVYLKNLELLYQNIWINPTKSLYDYYYTFSLLFIYDHKIRYLYVRRRRGITFTSYTWYAKRKFWFISNGFAEMWYFLCVWKREYYCGNSEKEVNVNLYLCQWYSDRTQIGTPEIRVSELSYLIYPTDFCLFYIFLVMTLMRLDIIIGKETWIVFFPLTYTWRYYIVFVYYYINMCLCLYIFVTKLFCIYLRKR